MKPGEIYWCNSDDGRRPAIIISREELNRGRYVVVILCTTARFELRSKLHNCVPFRAGEFGFTTDSIAQCKTISFVDRDEVDIEHGLLGVLDAERIRAVIRAVGYVIEAECEPV